MVASAGLGAAAVQTLHAQAKPPAYNIAEITTKEQDGYNKEYLPLVTKAITDAGGKFIVRGGNTDLRKFLDTGVGSISSAL